MNEEKYIILKNGLLINGINQVPMEEACILIKDKTISQIGKFSDIKIPDNAKIIDLNQMTIMPGLIDGHMHFTGWRTDDVLFESHIVSSGLKLLRAAVDAEVLLHAGFTTVRDCGSEEPNPLASDLKLAISEGTLKGPRILNSAWILSTTGGHDDFHYFPLHWAKEINPCICDGVPECMKAARLSLRHGADFIKICATGGVMSQKDSPDDIQFTEEEMKAIVKVAQNANTFVSAHAQGTRGINLAIECGVKVIDHANSPNEETLELGLKHEAIFVPTLYVATGILDQKNKNTMPEWAVTKGEIEWEKMKKGVKVLKDSGNIIAMGTDLLSTESMKQGTNARELELLVKYGNFSPYEAIKAATFGGAHACGLEKETGTIEAGKLADIIIVDGNPLENIKILQDKERIKMVLKEGEIEVNRGIKIT